MEPNRMSVHDFLVDVWLPARRATIRPSTAASYEGILRNYLIPKLGAKRLQSLTGADLNRLYDGLLTSGRTESRRHGMGPGLAPKSVRTLSPSRSRSARSLAPPDFPEFGYGYTISGIRMPPRHSPPVSL